MDSRRNGMKSAGKLILALLGLVLTTGCPFGSDVPLGSPGAGSLDPQLRGHWVWVIWDEHRLLEIDALPFNKDEYYFEIREKDKKVERYRAYTVRIGGVPFLNAIKITDDATRHSFIFARYSVGQDGALSLRFVGEKGVPKTLATDAKGLENFVAAHLEDASLYDSEAPIILRRPGVS
jgi:hypothetical protein